MKEERWFHIVENHDNLAGYYDEILNTVEEPDFIIRGYRSFYSIKATQREVFGSNIQRS